MNDNDKIIKRVSIWRDLFPAYASSPIYSNNEPAFHTDIIDNSPKKQSHIDAFPGYSNHVN